MAKYHDSELINSISEYLIMQAKAGADILMLFDSWGGLLDTKNYNYFSLNPMKEIISNLNNNNIDNVLFLYWCEEHEVF